MDRSNTCAEMVDEITLPHPIRFLLLIGNVVNNPGYNKGYYKQSCQWIYRMFMNASKTYYEMNPMSVRLQNIVENSF